METEGLVCLCTVNNPMEAEIIRSALESASIPCQIGGESQAGLAGVLEIEVLVHSNELEEARKYLRTLKHITREERRKAHEAKEAHRHAIQELKSGEIPPSSSTDIQLPPEGTQ